MIEESATVIKVEDGYAIVTTRQRAACGSCDSAGSCSTSVLAGLFKRRSNHLKVLNPIDAQPGEQVIVGLQEQALLRASFSAYLLPLVTMLLSAIAAQALSQRLMLQLGELPTISGGLLGLIIGLFLCKRVSLYRSADPNHQAVILRQAMTQQVPFV